jgi:hypothetical protein
MVLQLGEKIHPRRMHEHGETEFPHALIGQEEVHSHNVYKKDKHHLKLGSGL